MITAIKSVGQTVSQYAIRARTKPRRTNKAGLFFSDSTAHVALSGVTNFEAKPRIVNKQYFDAVLRLWLPLP
jgi:hypothetical protein